jgi:hypothetical protein
MLLNQASAVRCSLTRKCCNDRTHQIWPEAKSTRTRALQSCKKRSELMSDPPRSTTRQRPNAQHKRTPCHCLPTMPHWGDQAAMAEPQGARRRVRSHERVVQSMSRARATCYTTVTPQADVLAGCRRGAACAPVRIPFKSCSARSASRITLVTFDTSSRFRSKTLGFRQARTQLRRRQSPVHRLSKRLLPPNAQGGHAPKRSLPATQCE